ncbi:hypothetical protein Dimus_003217, partial [Dionaea muscipula]
EGAEHRKKAELPIRNLQAEHRKGPSTGSWPSPPSRQSRKPSMEENRVRAARRAWRRAEPRPHGRAITWAELMQ